jgi:hypothetical protein
MTAIATTATAKPADRFLRTILKVDAVTCAVTGAGFVALGELHKDMFGLPTALTLPAGIFLIVLAVGLWVIGSLAEVNTKAVWVVVAGNFAWVTASVLVIVAGLVDLTTLGVVFVAVQAAAVAVIAELEIVGLRKARR